MVAFISQQMVEYGGVCALRSSSFFIHEDDPIGETKGVLYVCVHVPFSHMALRGGGVVDNILEIKNK